VGGVSELQLSKQGLIFKNGFIHPVLNSACFNLVTCRINRIVIGLVVFEVVNSVDNAAVNAVVLKTMSVLAIVTFILIGNSFYKSGQLIKSIQPKLPNKHQDLKS
jgi:hypothetical protein